MILSGLKTLLETGEELTTPGSPDATAEAEPRWDGFDAPPPESVP